MSISITFFHGNTLFALCLLAPCVVAGAPLPVPALDPVQLAAGGLPATGASQKVLEIKGFGVAATPSQLDGARGGSAATNATVATTATLGGGVSGNSATNVTSGGNTITAGSFAGVSGIPIVIQNSGANVLIQNATVINLQFQ